MRPSLRILFVVLLLQYEALGVKNDTTLGALKTTNATHITSQPKSRSSCTEKYPDLCPPPPPDAEQEICFKSWFSFLSRPEEDFVTQVTALPVKPTVYVWETIKSFGLNSTYQDCTGIPRISIISTPTRTMTSSFAVTVWEQLLTGFHYVSYKNSALQESKLSQQPHCTFQDQDYYCRKLWAITEIGPDHAKAAWAPDYTVCPTRYNCSPQVDEVVLIYWPKDISSWHACASGNRTLPTLLESTAGENSSTTRFVVTTHAITFKGQDLYLRSMNGEDAQSYIMKHVGSTVPSDVRIEMANSWALRDEGIEYLTPSVMTGAWTFTYPTIYLAHRPISRQLFSRSLTSDGAAFTALLVRSAGIITLKPEDVSTVRPVYHTLKNDDHARLVANGSLSFTRSRWWERARSQTLPLNFDDLQDPVPASAYYDARFLDCWGLQSHCATITDGSFRPKLRLAPSLWASIFSGFACLEGMIVDPPIALSRLDPGEMSLQVASSPAPTLALPTSDPTTDPSGSLSNAADKNAWAAQARPTLVPQQPEETGLPRKVQPPGDSPPSSESRPSLKSQAPKGTGSPSKVQPPENSLLMANPLMDVAFKFFQLGTPHKQKPNTPQQGTGNFWNGAGGGGGDKTGNQIMTPSVYEGQSIRTHKRQYSIWALCFMLAWNGLF